MLLLLSTTNTFYTEDNDALIPNIKEKSLMEIFCFSACMDSIAVLWNMNAVTKTPHNILYVLSSFSFGLSLLLNSSVFNLDWRLLLSRPVTRVCRNYAVNEEKRAKIAYSLK